MKKICIALALSISTIVLVFNTTNVYAANNTGGKVLLQIIKKEKVSMDICVKLR